MIPIQYYCTVWYSTFERQKTKKNHILDVNKYHPGLEDKKHMDATKYHTIVVANNYHPIFKKYPFLDGYKYHPILGDHK